MNVSTWSIQNPIPAILFFVLLFLAGLVPFRAMEIQQFMDVDLPLGRVTATLPGVAPAQMENDEEDSRPHRRIHPATAHRPCARASAVGGGCGSGTGGQRSSVGFASPARTGDRVRSAHRRVAAGRCETRQAAARQGGGSCLMPGNWPTAATSGIRQCSGCCLDGFSANRDACRPEIGN